MRITGGTYRSRALRAPKGQATRPTTDRVREALFGILASGGAGATDGAGGIEGARVLDLYAGTGALALEALSRGRRLGGARRIGPRRARGPASQRGGRSALDDRARIVGSDVVQAMRRLRDAGPFDLVFADPPWAMVDAGPPVAVLSDLARRGGIAAEGRVVLEHSARTPSPDIDGLGCLDMRRYGDTALTFYKPAILAALRQ